MPTCLNCGKRISNKCVAVVGELLFYRGNLPIRKLFAVAVIKGSNMCTNMYLFIVSEASFAN